MPINEPKKGQAKGENPKIDQPTVNLYNELMAVRATIKQKRSKATEATIDKLLIFQQSKTDKARNEWGQAGKVQTLLDNQLLEIDAKIDAIVKKTPLLLKNSQWDEFGERQREIKPGGLVDQQIQDYKNAIEGNISAVKHAVAAGKDPDELFGEFHERRGEILKVNMGLEQSLQRLQGYFSPEKNKGNLPPHDYRLQVEEMTGNVKALEKELQGTEATIWKLIFEKINKSPEVSAVSDNFSEAQRKSKPDVKDYNSALDYLRIAEENLTAVESKVNNYYSFLLSSTAPVESREMFEDFSKEIANSRSHIAKEKENIYKAMADDLDEYKSTEPDSDGSDSELSDSSSSESPPSSPRIATNEMARARAKAFINTPPPLSPPETTPISSPSGSPRAWVPAKRAVSPQAEAATHSNNLDALLSQVDARRTPSSASSGVSKDLIDDVNKSNYADILDLGAASKTSSLTPFQDTIEDITRFAKTLTPLSKEEYKRQRDALAKDFQSAQADYEDLEVKIRDLNSAIDTRLSITHPNRRPLEEQLISARTKLTETAEKRDKVQHELDIISARKPVEGVRSLGLFVREPDAARLSQASQEGRKFPPPPPPIVSENGIKATASPINTKLPPPPSTPVAPPSSIKAKPISVQLPPTNIIIVTLLIHFF